MKLLINTTKVSRKVIKTTHDVPWRQGAFGKASGTFTIECEYVHIVHHVYLFMLYVWFVSVLLGEVYCKNGSPCHGLDVVLSY